MTVRVFAAHLGVSDRMVSKWEAGGRAVCPRPVNQAALDTSLRMAGDEVGQRFRRSLSGFGGRAGAPAVSALLPDGVRHLVRHPFDGKMMTLVDAGPAPASGADRRWLAAYFIDVEPVTNAEFARFLAETEQRTPAGPIGGDDQVDYAGPAVGVAWADACAYARWACKELPDAAQWHQAARGAEGMRVTRLREWCQLRGEPVECGPLSAVDGGFRCVAPVAPLLALVVV